MVVYASVKTKQKYRNHTVRHLTGEEHDDYSYYDNYREAPRESVGSQKLIPTSIGQSMQSLTLSNTIWNSHLRCESSNQFKSWIDYYISFSKEFHIFRTTWAGSRHALSWKLHNNWITRTCSPGRQTRRLSKKIIINMRRKRSTRRRIEIDDLQRGMRIWTDLNGGRSRVKFHMLMSCATANQYWQRHFIISY